MLKQDLTPRFYEMNRLLPKVKYSHWCNEWWIRWRNHGRIYRIKIKTCNNVIYGGREDEEKKGTKRVSQKKVKLLKLLRRIHLENKINPLEENRINVDRPKENHKEVIKNNKLIMKTQQRFRSESRNAFSKEKMWDCFQFKWC